MILLWPLTHWHFCFSLFVIYLSKYLVGNFREINPYVINIIDVTIIFFITDTIIVYWYYYNTINKADSNDRKNLKFKEQDEYLWD